MQMTQEVLIEQLADSVAATMLVLKRIQRDGDDSISVGNAIEVAENALEQYFVWEGKQIGVID